MAILIKIKNTLTHFYLGEKTEQALVECLL